MRRGDKGVPGDNLRALIKGFGIFQSLRGTSKP